MIIVAQLLLACSEYDVTVKPDALPGDTDTSVVDTAVEQVPDEVCGDGVDNDGDGATDEGFDADGNGVPDCLASEVCDGVDNDADGLVDEGFDADSDGVSDCTDLEECDHVDNDGDGAVDEGFDADGDGILDCDERTHTVEVALTADDSWEGWADGVSIGGDGAWNTVEYLSFTFDSGPHVIAIHAQDTGLAIAGFIAAVDIDGVNVNLTGDGAWRVAEAVPADPAWTGWAYDDTAWGIGYPCDAGDAARYWGGAPSELTSRGAQWIWPRGCTALDQAALRLRIELP